MRKALLSLNGEIFLNPTILLGGPAGEGFFKDICHNYLLDDN